MLDPRRSRCVAFPPPSYVRRRSKQLVKCRRSVNAAENVDNKSSSLSSSIARRSALYARAVLRNFCRPGAVSRGSTFKVILILCILCNRLPAGTSWRSAERVNRTKKTKRKCCGRSDSTDVDASHAYLLLATPGYGWRNKQQR